MKRVCSFDIFDTCLVRTCGIPSGVFDIMARRAIPLADETQLADFANIRINGEKIARAKSAYEEITLSEIYDCCDFSRLTSMSNSELMELEEAVEFDCLVPVKSMLNTIRDLRDKGNQIIFISDMYLPRKFVEMVMRANSIMADGDLLFVSSHERYTKASGRLYEVVKTAVGGYDEWIHYGDNPKSDVEIPKSLGIKTKMICHPMSSNEQAVSGANNIYDRNSGLISASLSKAVRLSMPEASDYEFASDYVAPLLVPFVYWLLEKSSKSNIEQLFFIARDGRILYEIAKRFKDVFPKIELHYLYLSRASLYFPASESYEKIFDMIDMDGNIEEAVDSLKELTGVDISGFVPSHDLELSEILKLPEIHQKLSHEYEDARKQLISYFEQSGLASSDNKSRAIVDLRGTAKSHDYINDVLRVNGYNVVKAFYLELTPGRKPSKRGEERYAAIYSERLYGSNRAIAHAYSLLESYYAAADHPRTIRYTKDAGGGILPVFARYEKSDDCNRKIFKVNQSVCCAWADLYIRTEAFNNNASILDKGFALIKKFMIEPEYKYLSLLTRLDISDTGKDAEPYVRKLRFAECVNRGLKAGSLAWYDACFRYTFGKSSWVAHKFFAVLSRVNKVIPIFAIQK